MGPPSHQDGHISYLNSHLTSDCSPCPTSPSAQNTAEVDWRIFGPGATASMFGWHLAQSTAPNEHESYKHAQANGDKAVEMPIPAL